ncbi:MAG: hypothetical protein Q7S84_01065 [bacterium]|nr:hypothetical protein [bacterium]
MFRSPKDDSRFSWTSHVVEKMQQYAIPESRIRRIIRYPARTEEGIAPDTVAVMQPGGSTRYHEIWVMYKLVTNNQRQTTNDKQAENQKREQDPFNILSRGQAKIRVITAWRYPGHSPARDPVPSEVLAEVQRLL